MTRLEWDGCVNVRDLGGLPTEDGGSLREGVLIRADSLVELSPRGWEAVGAAGVASVVDLRDPDSEPSAPPPELGIEITRVDLYPEDVLPTGELDGEDFEAASDLTDFFGQRYLDTLSRRAPQVAEALRAAAAANGPLVVHCRAGKDRTGVVIALILRLAGVPSEAIAADYALSATDGKVALERWVDAAPDAEQRVERIRRVGAPAESMRRMLDELDGRYGGARAYLLGIGVPAADLDRLTEKLKALPAS
jgi:protein-tyrosine phosphatase